MYRKRDFLLMEVVDIQGKVLGIIENILINFGSNRINGFLIEARAPFKKAFTISTESIVYYNDRMIIKEIDKANGIYISDILGMDVIKYNSDILGIVDDLIFGHNFKLLGIVVSSGILNNFMNGKQIILIDNIIIGDENIVYCNNSKVELFKMPYNILGSIL